LRVAYNQFVQRFTVIINQFTRNDNPAFIRRPVEVAEAFEQQARQFCRVTYRWRIIKLVARVIADTGFGGVGKTKRISGLCASFRTHRSQ
jgi:putative protein kinase ArgK-like GTPase of G3E family